MHRFAHPNMNTCKYADAARPSPFFRKWPQPCGTGKAAIIDVGTHIGDQVEYWGRNFGKAKGCQDTRIFLFEPSPATHQELLVNMKKKYHLGQDTFLPQRMAVSNKSGTAQFFYMGTFAGRVYGLRI